MMEVKLYMGTTINGMVAKASGAQDWGSREHIQGFIAACQRAQAVIMGRKTYDKLAPNYLPLRDQGTIVVLTHDPNAHSTNPTVMFSHAEPKEVLSILEAKGYKEVVIVGGANTAGEFMQAGLVKEVYLDVEPWLFGTGLPIFPPLAFEQKFSLVGSTQLNDSTLQLHYQVNP